MSDLRKLADIAESMDVESPSFEAMEESRPQIESVEPESVEEPVVEEAEEPPYEPVLSVDDTPQAETPDIQVESSASGETPQVESEGAVFEDYPRITVNDILMQEALEMDRPATVEQVGDVFGAGVEETDEVPSTEINIDRMSETPGVEFAPSVQEPVPDVGMAVESYDERESPKIPTEEMPIPESVSVSEVAMDAIDEPVINAVQNEAIPSISTNVNRVSDVEYPEIEGEQLTSLPDIEIPTPLESGVVAEAVDVPDMTEPDMPQVSVSDSTSDPASPDISTDIMSQPYVPVFGASSVELPDTGGFGRQSPPMFNVNVTMGAEEDFVKQLTEQLSPQLQQQQFILSELVKQQFEANNSILELMGDD